MFGFYALYQPASTVGHRDQTHTQIRPPIFWILTAPKAPETTSGRWRAVQDRGTRIEITNCSGGRRRRNQRHWWS
jgi:hypothetical protein